MPVLLASVLELAHATEDGAKGERDNSSFNARLGGRLQLDTALLDDNKTELKDGVIVRRARLSLGIDFWQHWRFRVQYDLADEEERYASLWLRYSGFSDVDVTLGQFQEPFGLEGSTSSNHIIFMERSLSNTLVPGTNVGISLRRWNDRWSVNGGVFWETYIEESNPFRRKEGYGISGRLTFVPIHQKYKVLHLGISASYRVPDDSSRVRFRARPESYLTDQRLISTGRVKNVNDYLTLGMESALMFDSLMLQGEYFQTSVYRAEGRDDARFDGAYLLASILLTGESRRYSNRSGNFSGVKLKKGGAWELAVRRSYLDLNSTSGVVRGGRQDNITWGVNWYPHQNLRVMLNYIQVAADDVDSDILQMRFQWAI